MVPVFFVPLSCSLHLSSSSFVVPHFTRLPASGRRGCSSAFVVDFSIQLLAVSAIGDLLIVAQVAIPRPLSWIASLSQSKRRAGQVLIHSLLTRIRRASTDAANLGGQPTLIVAATIGLRSVH